MDNRIRNAVIVGIGVTVLVVLAILFIGAGKQCNLQSEAPKLDPSEEVVNHKSSDFKAMANFAGYLVYKQKQDDDKKKNSTSNTDLYLNLELESIEQTGSWGDTKQPARLKLSTGCADLTVVLPTSEDKSHLEPFYFELDNISSDGDRTECTTGSPMTIFASQYYSCKQTKSYTCFSTKDKTKEVAQLIVQRLEFEVDGNPAAIKQGNFDKVLVSCK